MLFYAKRKAEGVGSKKKKTKKKSNKSEYGWRRDENYLEEKCSEWNAKIVTDAAATARVKRTENSTRENVKIQKQKKRRSRAETETKGNLNT